LRNFEKHKKWVLGEHDKSYLKELKEYDDVENKDQHAIVSGLMLNYRHLKGFALARAVFDEQGEDVKKNDFTDRLRELQIMQLDTLSPLIEYLSKTDYELLVKPHRLSRVA